ncbi:MAG: sigma-70 family RNA polymerase sigma factor [bacterium]|nr:sigma-70 family RNA polymerase sigma factor [bacterium]
MGTKPDAGQQAVNAALASLAKTGDAFALGQLWEINRGLLRALFWRWYPAHKALADAHGMTADDFEQEGYFAVQYAAQTYQPEAGSFSNWLGKAMQRQIQRTLTNGHTRTVTGEDGRQHKASADPLNHCTSLDVPLDDEDGGAATLGDLQEDATAAAELDAVEDKLFQEQLHSALEEALAKLTDREADVLHRLYYQQQPLREVGAAYDVAASRAQQIERTALHKLGRNPKLCRFHDEVIQYHAYRGTGFVSWKHGGSVEECLIEYLDSKGAYLYGVR